VAQTFFAQTICSRLLMVCLIERLCDDTSADKTKTDKIRTIVLEMVGTKAFNDSSRAPHVAAKVGRPVGSG
jgi:hypothetical protein